MVKGDEVGGQMKTVSKGIRSGESRTATTSVVRSAYGMDLAATKKAVKVFHVVACSGSTA